MRRVQRAVVTGATSFIGSALCKALLERNCQVYGLVRPSSTARSMLPVHPNFHEVTCELMDTDTWVRSVENADTFFHFAWGGPGAKGRADRAIQQQSAAIARICLRNAAKLGVKRFLFSGSQAEYGPVHGITTEETPCHPILEYGKSKLEVFNTASMLAKETGMEYVHARYFSVYGPKDHPYALIPSCIRCFLRDETIELSECTNMWNFLHVDDAAEATVRLAECALEEQICLVNLAGTDTRVLKDFVEEIHRLSGGMGRCAYGARNSAERPVDNWPNIGFLQRLTDWSPIISFEQGVKALIETEKKSMLEMENKQ